MGVFFCIFTQAMRNCQTVTNKTPKWALSSTQSIHWPMACITCTRTSVTERRDCAPTWPPSTDPFCSSTWWRWTSPASAATRLASMKTATPPVQTINTNHAITIIGEKQTQIIQLLSFCRTVSRVYQDTLTAGHRFACRITILLTIHYMLSISII